jgi:hypothetical protein
MENIMKRRTYVSVDGRKRQVFRDEDGRFTSAPKAAKKGSTSTSKPTKGKKGKGKSK